MCWEELRRRLATDGPVDDDRPLQLVFLGEPVIRDSIVYINAYVLEHHSVKVLSGGAFFADQLMHACYIHGMEKQLYMLSDGRLQHVGIVAHDFKQYPLNDLSIVTP
jgi:hypothetical protein